ncbi:hypothetical protein AB670_02758 [Chryseobacterium sp. MOF25P]|uniref:hypothetical protein n=1 Tax=unclassified Chryseobacterium TaxID=2593645 RepID=UPI000805421D|nr:MULTISPECIES: hypothetical protein [unclassified Chryseobacterium]OBW40807.1 hypothetical protein AB670_02758 [Chryseobacterium sp. MOF25P]OBW45271.1 hypothetical protein AB671_02568 [Chryseobacterium sp. BGARF1]
MDKKNICGLSETELEELKEKHGFLIVGTISQGESQYNAIFKEPDFKTLEATGSIAKNNEIKGTKALYDNCIVKADHEIENRDFLKLKSVECVANHMNSFSTSVKNL